MKRTFISATTIFFLTVAGHADELTDIQAQAKQLREQMTKRLADLERRQKALEASRPVVINPVDAMAADLPYKAAVKAKSSEDDGLCIKGICVYGDFDMGLIYVQHGAALSALATSPDNPIISKNSAGPYFGAGPNQMSNSYIGLRGKQEIADDLYAVFNLQTLFNVNNGLISNGIGSITQNNGLATNVLAQNSFGDSSKDGQMFSAAAYFGISSPTYGTFTMGRQSALSSDLLANYDPLAGANAWSLFAYLGGNGGGGDTEDRVFDNSYEYRVNVGPVRFAIETQLRSGGNSSTGNAFQGSIGFDYMGLSMDFLGGKIYDAVSAGILSATQLAMLNAIGFAPGNGFVSATVSDNTVFSVGARYTIGPWKLFGGYEYINFANPNNPLNPGAFVTGGFIAGIVNNTNFTNDKVQQTAWVGVKYAITPALDIFGAYYHEWQNSYATGANAGCTDARATQCSGSLDVVSLVVDWRFARHMVAGAERPCKRVPASERNASRRHDRRWAQQGLHLRPWHRSAVSILTGGVRRLTSFPACE